MNDNTFRTLTVQFAWFGY